MRTGIGRLALALAAVVAVALGLGAARAQEMRQGGTLVYGKPKDAVKLANVPLHPGAAKAYKEAKLLN